jgi:hypothetical protein
VDLETGAIVAVTVQGADEGDTTTIVDTVTAAASRLKRRRPTTMIRSCWKRSSLVPRTARR